MPDKKRGRKPGEKPLIVKDFIGSWIGENGYPPTIREIRDGLQLSTTSLVHYYLEQLEKAGLIERDGNTSRGLRLLDKPVTSTSLGKGSLSILLAGRIVASAPVPVPSSDVSYYDEESRHIEVPESLIPHGFSPDSVYALEVHGDSMVDAMIQDGDLVIFTPTHDVNNGEMIAAWLNAREETTLKYFYREGDRVRLQPANPDPAYKPIYVDAMDDLIVQGRVLAVYRQYKL